VSGHSLFGLHRSTISPLNSGDRPPVVVIAGPVSDGRFGTSVSDREQKSITSVFQSLRIAVDSATPCRRIISASWQALAVEMGREISDRGVW
ncbi:hypothetical protein, partial [Brevibacterium sediminis]|uniref:hypothetical protein n=1 Tax=Brevibacterium sediminis TaxID=1857024 RepID=UPI003B3B8B9A